MITICTEIIYYCIYFVKQTGAQNNQNLQYKIMWYNICNCVVFSSIKYVNWIPRQQICLLCMIYIRVISMHLSCSVRFRLRWDWCRWRQQRSRCHEQWRRDRKWEGVNLMMGNMICLILCIFSVSFFKQEGGWKAIKNYLWIQSCLCGFLPKTIEAGLVWSVWQTPVLYGAKTCFM